MALDISANQIYVENSDASTKFNGDEYLLYQTNYYSTGSQSYGDTVGVYEREFNMGFSTQNKAIVVIYATLSAADGNMLGGLTNYTIPLSGAVSAEIDNVLSGGSSYLHTEYLSASVYKSTLAVGLFRVKWNFGDDQDALTNATMTTEVYVYDHNA